MTKYNKELKLKARKDNAVSMRNAKLCAQMAYNEALADLKEAKIITPLQYLEWRKRSTI